MSLNCTGDQTVYLINCLKMENKKYKSLTVKGLQNTSFISFILIFSLLIFLQGCGPNKPVAVIITEKGNVPMQVTYGIGKLKEQLSMKGYRVRNSETARPVQEGPVFITGLAAGKGIASEKLAAAGKNLPAGLEGLVIHKFGNGDSSEIVICGSDANGLMYGLLDVARAVGLSNSEQDRFSLVKNIEEQADLAERSVSTYTMQRAWFESRLYDENYWKCYFDQLARSRFNSFVVIFGYENGGFMAPPYPYFFNTEGFPDITMTGITPEQQKKNVQAFNRMISLAHERGIKVLAGIWDHIYRGGVQSGGLPDRDVPNKPQPSLVWGVTTNNLTAYSLKSIEKFIDTFPGIDGIQFRMHPESGLTDEEMPLFWHNVFRMIMEKNPGMQVDLRAKGLPDEIIADAYAQGLKFRVTTKYWMEQMGLPFHPTHINKQNQTDRRHSYADLLRYPQTYRMHWRLWNGGTNRILLWGDPEYGRRFAGSAKLYNGTSFEINEPLATKMETQPQDAKPFDLLNPSYQYYKYEFERYWYLFDVFGRTGYKTATSEELWKAEFSSRFGQHAGPLVRQALHTASLVLPRIVASAYNYKYFPTTRGWAEKMHFGGLEEFSKGGGTDIQQFVSFEEEAENIILGKEDPRTSVFETSEWFAETSDSILNLVRKAENTGIQPENKEFLSTLTDLKIYGYLAEYYSHRVVAAVCYNLFKKTNQNNALDEAVTYEKQALEAWQKIVESAGNVYAKDLLMGICRMGMCGDWSSDLEQLKKEFQGLTEMQAGLNNKPGQKSGASIKIPVRKQKPGDVTPPEVGLMTNDQAIPGKPMEITAEVKDPSGMKWVKLRYRHLSQYEDYQTLEMKSGKDGMTYKAEIPGSFIVPQWDLMYFIETMDKAGNGKIYPDFRKETPYVVIKPVR